MAARRHAPLRCMKKKERFWSAITSLNDTKYCECYMLNQATTLKQKRSSCWLLCHHWTLDMWCRPCWCVSAFLFQRTAVHRFRCASPLAIALNARCKPSASLYIRNSHGHSCKLKHHLWGHVSIKLDKCILLTPDLRQNLWTWGAFST